MFRDYKSITLPRLRAVRKEKGLSQAELARRAHVSRATVSELEKGRRSQVRSRHDLARALGVDPLELVFEAEQVRVALEGSVYHDQLLRERVAAMSEEELAAFLKIGDPVHDRVRHSLAVAIEHDAKERESLDAENQQDAG
jgi:transcriptional regulator with XRE-family HTH domain